jgi:hypothetical protein
VRRSGIVLEGSFTAQVNADLEVGSVEETVTVAGYSPTINVVNTATTSVLNRDVLDSIPTDVRNTPGRALLLPGTQVTFFVLGQYNITVHGSATLTSRSRSTACGSTISADPDSSAAST